MPFDIEKTPRSKVAWEAGKEFILSQGGGFVNVFDLAHHMFNNSDLQPSSIFSLLYNLEKENLILTRNRKSEVALIEIRRA